MNYQVSSSVISVDKPVVGDYTILGVKPFNYNETMMLQIGANFRVGRHCSLYLGSKIGENVSIEDNCIIYEKNVIGNNTRIGPGAVVRFGNVIGNNVRIHSHCFLERVILGDFVFLGPHVVFTDDLHPPCPKYRECVPETVVEDHVSIGANVVIAPGVKIGHNSQIYAGSVVIRDVEPFSVVCGNPAKRIKDIREIKCRSNLYNNPFDWWK